MSELFNLETGVERAVDQIRILTSENPQVVVNVYGLDDRARDLVVGRIHTNLVGKEIQTVSLYLETFRKRHNYETVVLLDCAGFIGSQKQLVKVNLNIGTKVDDCELELLGEYDLSISVPKIKPRRKEVCRGYFFDEEDEPFGSDLWYP